MVGLSRNDCDVMVTPFADMTCGCDAGHPVANDDDMFLLGQLILFKATFPSAVGVSLDRPAALYELKLTHHNAIFIGIEVGSRFEIDPCKTNIDVLLPFISLDAFGRNCVQGLHSYLHF